MTKQLINLIGILVSIAVLALGIALIATPLVAQSLSTQAQASQVAQSNDAYQAEVDRLTAARADLATTQASVTTLRTQVPAAPQLDDVFALVATAAEQAGVSIASVTAGEVSPFVPRTSALSLDDQNAVLPAPDSPTESSPTPSPSPDDSVSAGSNAVAATPAGQNQVDFSISVSAGSTDQAIAFLDNLRAGPRLLGNITSTITRNGPSFQVNVTALTFFSLAQGSTP